MGLGGLVVDSVPCVRRIAGSNLIQALESNLRTAFECNLQNTHAADGISASAPKSLSS